MTIALCTEGRHVNSSPVMILVYIMLNIVFYQFFFSLLFKMFLTEVFLEVSDY